jgi:hypothetical protein
MHHLAARFPYERAAESIRFKEAIMKRLLFFLVIASIAFCWVGSAIAAPKPPKSICLNWVGSGAFTVICTKPMGGRINTLSGRTRLYEIHGEITNNLSFATPVSGAGHLLGTMFHFQLTGGSAGAGPTVVTYTFEGAFDVATGTGTGRYVMYGPGFPGGQFGPFALTPVNCATTTLPYTKSGTSDGILGDLFAP